MSTAAGNPKPAATKTVDIFVWNALGSSSAILFGEECASVAVWTFVVLLIRAVLYMINAEDFVPFGLLFAFPLLVEVSPPLLRSCPVASSQLHALTRCGRPLGRTVFFFVRI